MRLPGILTEDAELSSDDWYTPPHIIKAISLTYDLDPCAPPGGVPWIQAAEYFTEQDDGLGHLWNGRVWLNPPYSDPYPWVAKLFDHNNGIALIQCDTSSKLWHEFAPEADAVCFIRGRVKFHNPDDDRGWNARFASALLAFGGDNAQAVRASQLGWCP